jgi:hypothetical protein
VYYLHSQQEQQWTGAKADQHILLQQALTFTNFLLIRLLSLQLLMTWRDCLIVGAPLFASV